MKERTVPQVAVISAATPEQLQEKMNEELRHHPDVTNMTLSEGNSNRAIIQYEIKEMVPEDEADRYYIETGKHYCCNDCPECIWDPDRRSITHWCQLHEDRVRLKSPACDQFYLRLRSGDIHLVTAEERNARYEEMDLHEDGRRAIAKQDAIDLWKAKKREVKYTERLLKVTTQLREELEAVQNSDALTQPNYVIECYDRSLGCNPLLPHEIALIAYGSRRQLSEKEIIKVAKQYNAFEVWRLCKPTYIDEDTMTWDEYDCIWINSKKQG